MILSEYASMRLSVPVLLALAVTLQAQTGASRDSYPSGLGWSNLLERTIAPVPMVPGGYVPDDTYKLRKGDKLSFQILEDREPPRACW